ncbi:MAG: hypothetical protein ABSE06_16805 [Anaerolineaceae bacterium]|jgi:hypothetical protein
MNDPNDSFNKPNSLLDSIREINEKYKTPRIHMTRLVRISLVALRVYLLVMLLILFYKFGTLVIH